MKPYQIDISNLDRAEMVAALFNAAKGPFGTPAFRMAKEEAQAEIDALLRGKQGKSLYFDYLRGRCMKIHFGRDLLDTRLYDRDNGQGAAALALAPLLETVKDEMAEAAKRAALDGKRPDEAEGDSVHPDFECEDDCEEQWDEGDWFDCGIIRGRDGKPEGCTKAGSEECDFDCPHRDWLYSQFTTEEHEDLC